MPRYKLPTLLAAVTAWLSAVVGALIGMVAANNRIADNLLPSVGILLGAVAWGAAIGIVPSLGLGTVLLDRDHAIPHLRWLWTVWSAIAVASGISLYIFAVSSAAI